MISLSDELAAAAFDRFGISFPFHSMVAEGSAAGAWLMSLLLSFIYCIFSASVLFTGELMSKCHLGWLLSIGIHLVGYIFLQESYAFLMPFALPVRAMLGFSYLSSAFPTLGENIAVLMICTVVTLFTLFYYVRQTDLTRKEAE